MAPQSGQGKKESVIWAVIQLGFPGSEAARHFHISGRKAGDGCKIIYVREFLTEKLGGVNEKFQHQNRTPD